jgi:hypothetical protein
MNCLRADCGVEHDVELLEDIAFFRRDLEGSQGVLRVLQVSFARRLERLEDLDVRLVLSPVQRGLLLDGCEGLHGGHEVLVADVALEQLLQHLLAGLVLVRVGEGLDGGSPPSRSPDRRPLP